MGGLITFIAGVLFLASANTFMQETSSTEFCISCHEMRDNVYQEYIQSVHYKNTSGVRAGCADCHVPKAWGPKVLSKLYAANDVYHKILGTVDTPEKFEQHRLAMAQKVWQKMKNNDSRECRSCHDYQAMDRESQGRSAKKRHDPKKLAKKDKTCIDCHQGIVHKLPDGY
jgi:cytochrome c-type protein NapC